MIGLLMEGEVALEVRLVVSGVGGNQAKLMAEVRVRDRAVGLVESKKLKPQNDEMKETIRRSTWRASPPASVPVQASQPPGISLECYSQA